MTVGAFEEEHVEKFLADRVDEVRDLVRWTSDSLRAVARGTACVRKSQCKSEAEVVIQASHMPVDD